MTTCAAHFTCFSDVNECNVNNGDCTEQQNCINTHGSMYCIVKGNSIGSQSAGEITSHVKLSWCVAAPGFLI